MEILVSYVQLPNAFAKLIPSILIGAAGSLAAASVSLILEWFFSKRRKKQEKINKKVVVSTVGAAAALAFASMLIGFDIHFSVPNLDYLLLADAEDRLSEQCLDSFVIPLVDAGIQLGHVVPNSQDPPAGLFVRPRTKVTFRVKDEGVNSLDDPRTNGEADCIMRSEGFCMITAEGRGSALVSSGKLVLLLWAKSRESGWYLQSPSSAQPELFRPDGTWTQQAQIGNSRYPPSEGELVDLTLTVISSAGAKRLDRRRGEAFQQPEGWPVTAAERVSIRLTGGR